MSTADPKSSPSSNSLSGMLSTLIPLLIPASIFVTLFLVGRNRFTRLYKPRTFVKEIPEDRRTAESGSGIFGWIPGFRAQDDELVLNKQSLDGYLFLRHFKMLVLLCLGGCVITWPVLFPVNATGGAGQNQFDLLSITNISDTNRYYAQAFMAMIFYSFVMFVVSREYFFYVTLRQAYMTTPFMTSRMSTRTVLFQDLPEDYRTEEALKSIFPAAKYMWLQTDTSELEDLVEDRDKTAFKLEGAEIKLSKTANKYRLKSIKQAEKKNSKESAVSGPDAFAWADKNKRPTHKLGFLGLFGKKVDSIAWCREHLTEVIPKVESMQEQHWNRKVPLNGAVFIEFENTQDAEQAFSQISYHLPKIIQPRAIGQIPGEIVWGNLSMPWWKRDVLYVVSIGLVVFLILIWTPLVAFVGAVANINYLEQISFLTWIADIPSVVLGVVTGLLPTVALAVLMAIVPIFLAMIAKFAGAASVGEIQLKLQNWYFWFQVIEVFLVVTIGSSAASVGKQIASNPSSAASLLANNLPKASNFYINYFVVNGIGISAATLVNYIAVILFIVLGGFLDSSPRKKYKRYVSIASINYGKLYPKFSILAVIALTYSIIAPLILGFATIAFFLIYMVYRYNIMYAMDTRPNSTQGRTYPQALQHLMVGVYIGQICLVGLFAIGAGSSAASAGPLVLMILFLVATILFHLWLGAALKPYAEKLPRDLLLMSQRAAGQSGGIEAGRSTVVMSDDKGAMEHHSTATANAATNGTAASGAGDPMPGRQTMAMAPPAEKLSMVERAKRWLLHPTAIPRLTGHLEEPVPAYADETRREAFFNPAVTAPPPLLWIVHDDLGASRRAKDDNGKVIGVSDEHAWWDDKGALQTCAGDAYGERTDGLSERDAPIYEPRVVY